MLSNPLRNTESRQTSSCTLSTVIEHKASTRLQHMPAVNKLAHFQSGEQKPPKHSHMGIVIAMEKDTETRRLKREQIKPDVPPLRQSLSKVWQGSTPDPADAMQAQPRQTSRGVAMHTWNNTRRLPIWR